MNSIIIPNWKQPKCSLIINRMNEKPECCDCYRAIKINEVVIHGTPWIES